MSSEQVCLCQELLNPLAEHWLCEAHCAPVSQLLLCQGLFGIKIRQKTDKWLCSLVFKQRGDHEADLGRNSSFLEAYFVEFKVYDNQLVDCLRVLTFELLLNELHCSISPVSHLTFNAKHLKLRPQRQARERVWINDKSFLAQISVFGLFDFF